MQVDEFNSDSSSGSATLSAHMTRQTFSAQWNNPEYCIEKYGFSPLLMAIKNGLIE
jgi:hypothetical protein